MRKLLILFTFILCLFYSSCLVKNQAFRQEKLNRGGFDYIYDSQSKKAYLPVSRIENIREIGTKSNDKLVIYNSNLDTIYIFSGVIDNSNMFYSKKNCYLENGNMILDSYYENYIYDAVHSGIRRNTFIEVLPMDSLVINIDKSQISENFGNQFDKGSFKFYYFVQNGYFHVGLIDSSQIQMMEGLLDFYFE